MLQAKRSKMEADNCPQTRFHLQSLDAGAVQYKTCLGTSERIVLLRLKSRYFEDSLPIIRLHSQRQWGGVDAGCLACP